MRFSGTSILGQWGQICFSEFLKIISSFLAQIFCTDRVDILLCSERKKNGGKSRKLGTLAPSKYCGRRRQARARLRPRRVFKRKMINLNISNCCIILHFRCTEYYKITFCQINIDNRLTRNHSLKKSSSQLAVAIRLEKQLSDKKIFVSSANRIRCKRLETLAMSCIYIKNNKGPRIDP